MATHSSILAWKILWAEEPGRLQSRSLQSQTHIHPFASRQVSDSQLLLFFSSLWHLHFYFIITLVVCPLRSYLDTETFSLHSLPYQVQGFISCSLYLALINGKSRKSGFAKHFMKRFRFLGSSFL